MPISPERIQKDLDAIAACTETPGEGASRATFSDGWRKARDYVISELEKIGAHVKIDAAGNVHARPGGLSFESAVWMSGSHIDSVPHGGNYDGVVGVIVPLEVMRAASEDLKVSLPLELVIWAEEEGTTFGLGMLGSRAYIGDLNAEQLRTLRNKHGQNYFEAGTPHGVREADIGKPEEKFNRRHMIGLIECHVEQGPGLWNQDCPLAVVTAIAGRRQYRCTLNGVANHAGATMMSDRKDALAGAAEMIVALEKLGRDLGHRTVITVGQINCKPNALNVIADEVNFTIDFRSSSMEIIARGDDAIRELIVHIADHRNLIHALDVTESQPLMEMAADVCAKIDRVAKAHCGAGKMQHTTSGALHDAAIIAPHGPTAMLFIASRDGISHNPDEFSRTSDIALAAKVLFDTVKDRRLE